MQEHTIVSQAHWLSARKQLLAKERELTQLRDQLSAQRRALPWVAVTRSYAFEGPQGTKTLAELFESKSQLIVYHLMFDPSSQAPCKSCAFWADAFDGMRVHLAQRDVQLVAVSRAARTKLQRFQERMGWRFPWYSAEDESFNVAYGVTFQSDDPAERARYNFGTTPARGVEQPGVSVFARDQAGAVFHTYSCYARGLDALNPAYQYLDLVPQGRNEAGLSFPMAWVRHHDDY
jgi:predicted dithiol-disulfide oxidoreductase (DUF899 family)